MNELCEGGEIGSFVGTQCITMEEEICFFGLLDTATCWPAYKRTWEGRFLQDRHQVSKWLWKSSPLAFLPLLPPLRSPPPRRADPGKGSGCALNAKVWLCKSINWIWIYTQSGWKLFCGEIIGAIETVGSLDGDTLKAHVKVWIELCLFWSYLPLAMFNETEVEFVTRISTILLKNIIWQAAAWWVSVWVTPPEHTKGQGPEGTGPLKLPVLVYVSFFPVVWLKELNNSHVF